MKICPKCGKSYPDDSAAFCFNDGVPLKAAPVESSESESDTSAPPEPDPAAAPAPEADPAARAPARGGIFSAPSPLQALEAPLPPVSSHTLLPDDYEAPAAATLRLGPHQLGQSIVAAPELMLFGLGDGRAAWMHPPDRPGRESFVKRVELARRAGDPSLLRVQDQGEHQQVAYAVVAKAAGHDLHSLMEGLKAKGVQRLEAPFVWELGRALAGALSGLHRAAPDGIVGDLHPRRIFVDHEGRIQLLALVGPAPALPLETELDAWARLAPEQCMRPDSVDARSDLFGLGSLLWTLLTGRDHHLKADRISTIKALAEGPPLDLASPLHALLARCMDPDPERRPQSADALLDALKEIGQADKAHWGALVAQAFPAGAPALTGDQLERVDGLLAILRGDAPLPTVEHAAPEMPEWPAEPAAAEPESSASESESGAAESESGAAEPESGAETPESDAAKPEAGAAEPESDADEPEAGLAGSLSSPAGAGADSTGVQLVEKTADEDSLAGGFFSDPTPESPEAAPVDPEPPVQPQRSWGLTLAGAALGLALLGGAGYLAWSASQEEAPPEPAAQQDPEPTDVKPVEAPKPPPAEEPAEPEAEEAPTDPTADGEQEAPEDAEPEPPAEPASEEPATQTQSTRTGGRRASTGVSTGSTRRGGGTSSGGTSGTTAGGGTTTDGETVGVSTRKGRKPPQEEPAADEWEASPWGASQEQPKEEDKAAEGNPWGEVE